MSRKNTKIILISLVVILLIVVGVYAFTSQDNKTNSSGSEDNIADEIDSEEGSDMDENNENIEAGVSTEEQRAVNTYLENNISDLSPEEAVLGGSFYITSVSFTEEDVSIVNYEDGYTVLTAEANYTFNNGEIEIKSFKLLEGSTVEREKNTNENICEDMCGDGSCQEIVCMGEGCPCPETAQSCLSDCS